MLPYFHPDVMGLAATSSVMTSISFSLGRTHLLVILVKGAIVWSCMLNPPCPLPMSSVLTKLAIHRICTAVGRDISDGREHLKRPAFKVGWNPLSHCDFH